MSFTHLKAAQDALKEHAGLDIFNRETPRSVYNMVPAHVKEAMDKVPREYALLSEKQVRKEVDPDFRLDAIRIAFWTEYQRAQLTATRLNMANVYSDVCPESTFRDLVLAQPKNLAWVLTPPTSWVAGMRTILDRGLQVMYDAVTAEGIFVNKEIANVKALNAVLKVIKDAHVVVHGLPTIKMKTESVSLNVNTSTPSPSYASLEEKRKELERLRAAKDVTPNTESQE